ncbi:unnamed protein product [Linum tenue]|uniref:Uncharacterized protein n=1 Tax=Linum tenue TaxID=586396 RepID=A0AAV0KHS2_9ROSI|nr:unnamed protein product [Linum tenue]
MISKQESAARMCRTSEMLASQNRRVSSANNKIRERPSMTIRKRKGERGSPCRSPL